MTLQCGTPIRFHHSSGNIYPGFVFSDDGVNQPTICYFDGNDGTLHDQWHLIGASRDDSGPAVNYFAVVSIESECTITTKFEGA